MRMLRNMLCGMILFAAAGYALETQQTITGNSSGDGTSGGLSYDGDMATAFVSDNVLAAAWIKYDLGLERKVSRLRLAMNNGASVTYPVSVKLIDGQANETEVWSGPTKRDAGFTEVTFDAQAARYVQVTMTAVNSTDASVLGIAETQIWGVAGGQNHFVLDGAVGVGTTTPEPGYKLDVRGVIRAQEVIVETSGADYVFDPDYKLRPLSEVAAHVKEYKHLPGIAPADTMQKDGMPVADQVTKHLEKIEELTIYTSDMDEKLSKLEQELQEQVEELKSLRVEKLKSKNTALEGGE